MAFRAGKIALLGAPNVGKSTLMNAIVGRKVSIVSNKPQTTRRRVVGIKTTDDYQIVFIDTPGVHEPHTTLGKTMVESARRALNGVDAVLIVTDGSHHPGELDRRIATLLNQHPSPEPLPRILVLNKMDLLRAENVVRNVTAFQELYQVEEAILTTATRQYNVNLVLDAIVKVLPEGEPLYDANQFTDQSLRELSREFVRERILTLTRQEVPHATAVLVDEWEDKERITTIRATILVEKSSQRAILIGKGGAFLKRIGMEARAEIEGLLGHQVHLDLHVRVSEDWRMNRRILHELEYDQ